MTPVATHTSSETRLVRALTICLFAGIVIQITVPFFSHLSWMTLMQDDFFYYLQIGRNLAQGHGSTSNGIVPTNGYHPLWMLAFAALSFFTQSPQLIVAFVALTILVASAVTFVLAQKLLRHSSVRPLLAFGIAAWITIFSFGLFCEAMEVTLAIPVIFAVISMLDRVEWLERSAWHTFLLGLLLSAMVLSRIDTLILGGLLLAGILISPGLRPLLKPRLVLGAFLGFSPVILYFVTNRLYFHVWMPVSGMAKQLKLPGHPSLPGHTFFSTFGPFTEVLLLAVLAALLLVPGLFRRLSSMQRVVFLSVILFPFVYYASLARLSDWAIWSWYFYPIRPALCIAAIIFCLSSTTSRLLQRPAVAWVLTVTVFAYLATHGWRRTQFDEDDAARGIQQFAQTHPGIYAMGDRSGRVAYLLPYPVVQLEGLVMDRPFLDYISHQTPLRSVLADYHARFYIATEYAHTGCFEADEPHQAGPSAPHLRDQFCEAPVATFPHNGFATVIFDLDPGGVPVQSLPPASGL